MKLLLLLSIILFPFIASADPAIKILCDSGLTHSIAQVKTVYANAGDHIFYKETKASNGMLLLTDGKVQKFKGEGNRVVVAIVKNYS
jgi:hypothetical protein